MVEVTQQFHFTQGSQAEHGVIERSDLLDGHLLAGRLVDCRASVRLATINDSSEQDSPYDTVGSLTNDVLNLILIRNVEGDLTRSPLRRLLHHSCGILELNRCQPTSMTVDVDVLGPVLSRLSHPTSWILS